jgi:hypothetical protein
MIGSLARCTQRKTTEAAAPPLILWSPRRIRGRPSGLKGASHRAARDTPTGVPLTPEPLRPLSQETRAGPSLPHPVGGLHKISHPFNITTTEVSTVPGD